MLTRIRHSNTSTDKQDLQSDFIFPMTENARSQHAVARGKIMRKRNQDKRDSCFMASTVDCIIHFVPRVSRSVTDDSKMAEIEKRET